MKILSMKRLCSSNQQLTAIRKYKRKRMHEMCDSSLHRIIRDESEPRFAMATRELRHRSAVKRRMAK